MDERKKLHEAIGNLYYREFWDLFDQMVAEMQSSNMDVAKYITLTESMIEARPEKATFIDALRKCVRW